MIKFVLSDFIVEIKATGHYVVPGVSLHISLISRLSQVVSCELCEMPLVTTLLTVHLRSFEMR